MEEYKKKTVYVLLASIFFLLLGYACKRWGMALGVLFMIIGFALLLYYAFMRSVLKKKRQQAEQAAKTAAKAEPKPAPVRSVQPAAEPKPELTEGLMQFKIAGVTYYNDDGSSRQSLIRDIDDRGSDKFSFYFKRYDYGDRPAIAFYCVNEFGIEKMLGNIPSDRREEFERIFDRIIGIKYVDVVGGGGLSYGLRVGVRYRQ